MRIPKCVKTDGYSSAETCKRDQLSRRRARTGIGAPDASHAATHTATHTATHAATHAATLRYTLCNNKMLCTEGHACVYKFIKRDQHTSKETQKYQKSSIHFKRSKETYIHPKRPVCIKTDLPAQKETHNHQNRPSCFKKGSCEGVF